MPERIPLSLLPRELAALTRQPTPGYRHIYNAVLDGRVPGVDLTHGRWTSDPAALPAIASALGLTVPPISAAA